MNVEAEDNSPSKKSRTKTNDSGSSKGKVSFLRPPDGKDSIEKPKKTGKSSNHSSNGKRKSKGSFDESKSNSSHSSKHIP